MREHRSWLYQYVGFRVEKNLYNRFGVLVIPSLSILSRKDIEMLIQHDIELEHGDMEHLSITRLVDCAVNEIKEAFVKVRDLNLIPYDDIRDYIMPMIVEMCNHPDLIHILLQLEQHDEYTYRHSIGVAILSRFIGNDLGLGGLELLELTTAGFLHDIGKAKIPEEVINKPGKLSPEEFDQMKKHTLLGFEIIKRTPGLSHRQALVAQQHHEREDGNGYPYGLKSDEIDFFSKIVAIADVFHAMISKRVYKSPVPFYKVFQEMSQNAYGVLESTITLSFLKRLMDMTIGKRVMLSNGVVGKIIMVSAGDPVNPLVEVNGTYIDLSKEQTVCMDRIL